MMEDFSLVRGTGGAGEQEVQEVQTQHKHFTHRFVHDIIGLLKASGDRSRTIAFFVLFGMFGYLHPLSITKLKGVIFSAVVISLRAEPNQSWDRTQSTFISSSHVTLLATL